MENRIVELQQIIASLLLSKCGSTLTRTRWTYQLLYQLPRRNTFSEKFPKKNHLRLSQQYLLSILREHLTSKLVILFIYILNTKSVRWQTPKRGLHYCTIIIIFYTWTWNRKGTSPQLVWEHLTRCPFINPDLALCVKSLRMKIAVLGATGQTGQYLVNQALQQGHTVTAIVRNPGKLTVQHDNLKVKQHWFC